MPAKSILEVDVNDQSFRQFNALFQRYQQQLTQMPLQWRNAAAAQQQSVKGFRELSTEQAAMVNEQRRHVDLLLREEKSWGLIKRSTKDAADSITAMTGQFLKWASLGLIGGGVLGIGQMAGRVASGRRSALGLGATYGQQKAFGTAFDRFVDPGSVLSGVAGALTDVAKRGSLYNAGLGEKDLTGSSAEVAARLLTKAQQLAKNTKDQFLGTIAQNRGFADLGLTEDDFRSSRRSSVGCLATMV
jgi:hypothetical protein